MARKRSTRIGRDGRGQRTSKLSVEAASKRDLHVIVVNSDSDTTETQLYNGVVSVNDTTRTSKSNQGTEAPEDPGGQPIAEILRCKFQHSEHGSGRGALRLLVDVATTSPQGNDVVDTNEMQPDNGVVSSNYTPNRTVLEVIGRNFVDTSVPRHITSSLRVHYNGVWPSWKFVPAEVKEEIWRKFKEAYYWTEAEEGELKSIWAEVCSRHLSAMLADARRHALADSGEKNLTDAKSHHPNWIPDDIWRALIDQHWSGPKWERISAMGRKNRLTKKEGSISKHCAGSIPFMLHKQRMEKELQRPVTQLEVFNRTHRRNKGKGDFIDGKSKVVSEAYSATISTKYGTDISSQPPFDPDAWVSATGTTSHGKLYRFGTRERPKQILSQGQNYSSPSPIPSVQAGSSSNSNQPLTEEQVKQMIQKNAEEMEKVFEQRWLQRKTQLQEKFVRELDGKIEQRLHHIMAGKGLL